MHETADTSDTNILKGGGKAKANSGYSNINMNINLTIDM